MLGGAERKGEEGKGKKEERASSHRNNEKAVRASARFKE